MDNENETNHKHKKQCILARWLFGCNARQLLKSITTSGTRRSAEQSQAQEVTHSHKHCFGCNARKLLKSITTSGTRRSVVSNQSGLEKSKCHGSTLPGVK
jgi:hypothetical protein